MSIAFSELFQLRKSLHVCVCSFVFEIEQFSVDKKIQKKNFFEKKKWLKKKSFREMRPLDRI